MQSSTDAETQAFLDDIEKRRGGSITYRTFSTFYADSNHKVCDFGVFFYEVNGEFWFEDFEHQPSFLGFKLKTRKELSKYEKFESSFKPQDVEAIRTVTKKAARSYAIGNVDYSKLKNAIVLRQLLSEVVTEIRMKDGRVMFFQFMDKTVIKKIKEIQGD